MSIGRRRRRGQGQARDSDSTDDLCSEGTKTIEHDQGYGRTGRDNAAPYAAACRLQALEDRSGLGEDSCVHFIAFPYSLMCTLTWASLKAAGERSNLVLDITAFPNGAKSKLLLIRHR